MKAAALAGAVAGLLIGFIIAHGFVSRREASPSPTAPQFLSVKCCEARAEFFAECQKSATRQQCEALYGQTRGILWDGPPHLPFLTRAGLLAAMKRKYPRERLKTAMCPGGTVVHLVRYLGHQPICGSRVAGECAVHARVTCKGCRQKRPVAAARRDSLPHVIGLDFSPFYDAMRRAVDRAYRGIRDGTLTLDQIKQPKAKVAFLPVLAPASLAQ